MKWLRAVWPILTHQPVDLWVSLFEFAECFDVFLTYINAINSILRKAFFPVLATRVAKPFHPI